MTLFKHTEPPIKSGYYHTDNGYFYFNEETGRWTDLVDSDWEERVKFWYSPSPPQEIELALSALKHNFLLNEMKYSTLSKESTEALLKLRAE